MNKYLLSLLSVTLLSLCTACVDETALRSSIRFSLPTLRTIDMCAPDGGTRTEVINEATDGGNNYQYRWAAGDNVGIFPEQGTQVVFAIPSDGDGSTTFAFDGGGWKLRDDVHYAAYYPLQPEFYLDPTHIPLDLTGLVQKGNGMRSSDRPAVMGILYSSACMPDGKGNLEFRFHHVVSVLHFRIHVPVNGGYTAIRLVTDGQFVTQANLDCFAEENNVTPLSTAHELTLRLEDVSVSRKGDDTYLDVFFPFIPVDLSNKTLRVEAVYESGFDFIAEARAIDFTQHDAGTFFNYSPFEATFTPVVVNYIPQADETRAVENPHKGWYHHYYNNSVVGDNEAKYTFSSSETTTVSNHAFPSLDHLYVRLSWADFEPTEGKYDWSRIDNLVKTYGPMGYGISVRIACRETGSAGKNVTKIVPYNKTDGRPVPYRDELYHIRNCYYDKNSKRIVSVEKNPTISSSNSYKNCYFATPYWVVQKGAKGTLVCDVDNGNFSWAPDYDDPVFLAELRKFHEAFVAHCNATSGLREALRYIDIGSLGEWGEGHNSYSTGVKNEVSTVKAHYKLFSEVYAAMPEVPLVALENAMIYEREDNKTEIYELMNDAFDVKKFGLRYDSYLVDYHLKHSNTGGFNYGVLRPYIFEEAYAQNLLIVHEQDVYENIKSAGNWQGKDGTTKFTLTARDGKSYQVTGRDIFIESMRRTHPTYIGYQAKLSTYLSENPNFVKVAGNLAGYWLFPLKATLTASTLTVHWLNKGVAPCLYPYELRLHFVTADGTDHRVDIADSGNLEWKPAPVDMANQPVVHPTEDIPVSAYANDSYLTAEKGVTMETYRYSFPKEALTSGTKVYMELYDPLTARSIDVGLKKSYLDTADGHIYIPIGTPPIN